MGQAATTCCLERGINTAPNSYIGDDAFFDCDEGDASHNHLFLQKASVLGHYSAHAVQRQMPCVARDGGDPLQPEGAQQKALEGNWLGKTARRWTGPGSPPQDRSSWWTPGSGQGLRLRGGRNARGSIEKTTSTGSMYECVSMDFVRAGCKLEDILGRLVDPPAQAACGAADRSGGEGLRWARGCPLPRVICVNVMLPFQAGPKLWGPHPANDHGASFVAIFEIKPETLQLLQRPNPPCWVKLFQEFFQGPSGSPGGPPDAPERALEFRRNPKTKLSDHPGMFKALAFADNMEDIGVPDFMRRFNGKPALISKSGYVVKDKGGEWLELGVDIRRFCPLARNMLVTFRDLVPKASLHFGFLIQGVADEELPEGLLGDVHVHFVDMLRDPVLVHDPRADQ